MLSKLDEEYPERYLEHQTAKEYAEIMFRDEITQVTISDLLEYQEIINKLIKQREIKRINNSASDTAVHRLPQ